LPVKQIYSKEEQKEADGEPMVQTFWKLELCPSGLIKGIKPSLTAIILISPDVVHGVQLVNSDSNNGPLENV
jgi:hypothetical protein